MGCNKSLIRSVLLFASLLVSHCTTAFKYQGNPIMKNFPQTMFRCVFNQDFNQDGSFNYEDFLYIHSPVWVQKLDSGLPPNGDPKIQYGSFRATWDYPLLNSAMQVQKVLTIRMDFRVTASKWSHYQDTIEYVNGRVDGFRNCEGLPPIYIP